VHRAGCALASCVQQNGSGRFQRHLPLQMGLPGRTGMVEETRPTNKHSLRVDELGEFADECRFLTRWESNSRYRRRCLLDPFRTGASFGSRDSRPWEPSRHHARSHASALDRPASVLRLPNTRRLYRHHGAFLVGFGGRCASEYSANRSSVTRRLAPAVAPRHLRSELVCALSRETAAE